MSLVAGTRLGPYELQSLIGQGGMGQVYKARDTRLDRSVAIKVLPPAFSADPDRRARFEREAKTIAGLNHPHICTLHDVGEADLSTLREPQGRPEPGRGATGSGQAALYLVMEHLQGETLADRLTKGPLPLEQALTVATEVADALSAAHRQGVIHRDLKPGNVMLTKAGAKLLDFGLAKLTGHGEQAAAASLASAPTQTKPLTSEGAIVGTLQYMAPEQVEGKPADARTDLWALGAILYEILTGKRAFAGDSAASLIGNIMNAEPAAMGTLQPLTPPSVDRLVRRCLAKDPNERWESARDLADELRWLGQSASAAASPTRTGASARGRRWRWKVTIAAVLLVAMTAGGLLILGWLSAYRTPLPPVYSWLDVAPAARLGPSWQGRLGTTALALSPDGRTLVFTGYQRDTDGTTQLYRVSLDRDDAQAVALAGTEGAEAPFFSPDGLWIGFWSEPNEARSYRSLKKVTIAGDAVSLICRLDAPGIEPAGASWGDDGHIVFAGISQQKLRRVAANGGAPIPLPGRTPDATVLELPHILPGARVVLAQERQSGVAYSYPDRIRIVALDVATGARHVVQEQAADPRLLAGRYLMFANWGQVFAAPFDPVGARVTGTPALVLDHVMQGQNSGHIRLSTAAAQVAVSASGGMAYVPGGVVPDVRDQRLVWRNRTTGRREPLSAPLGDYGFARLSPDGKRLAFRQLERGRARVGVYDIVRSDTTWVTRGGEANFPLWWDESRLVFSYKTEDGKGLAWVPADKLDAEPTWLVKNKYGLIALSWTPDGQTLWVLEQLPDVPSMVRLLSLPERGETTLGRWREVPPTAAVNQVEVSPKGRRVAYIVREGGRSDVYVESLTPLGGRHKVSRGGKAWNPLWAPDGRVLFYTDRTKTPFGMMAVEIRQSGGPPLGPERLLFEGEWLVYAPRGYSCISPDGSRFLLVEREPAAAVPVRLNRIRLVQNWFEVLKTKVPEKR